VVSYINMRFMCLLLYMHLHCQLNSNTIYHARFCHYPPQLPQNRCSRDKFFGWNLKVLVLVKLKRPKPQAKPRRKGKQIKFFKRRERNSAIKCTRTSNNKPKKHNLINKIKQQMGERVGRNQRYNL
jgi:hypothetical protein